MLIDAVGGDRLKMCKAWLTAEGNQSRGGISSEQYVAAGRPPPGDKFDQCLWLGMEFYTRGCDQYDP